MIDLTGRCSAPAPGAGTRGRSGRGTGHAGTAQQTGFHFSGLVWLCFAFAVVGPLFLTNILWFTAISRVG